MRTVDKIFTKAYNKYGSSFGRNNVGEQPTDNTRVYDCKVKRDSGGYDKGGAYWGIGGEVRVSYTKDLSFVKFYWKREPR